MRKREMKQLVDWAILAEDNGGDGGDGDGGGDWGGGGGGWGGGGGGYGGGASLYSTFIQPFTDVFDEAKSVVETGMSKVQLLSGIATYAVLTTFLPFIRADFNAMMEHDKRRMNHIYSKYADVFARTDAALTETGGDYDGAGIFFVLFPRSVIAKNLVTNVGAMGGDAAKTAVDTAFDFLDAVTLNTTAVVTDPLRKKLGFVEGAWHGSDLLTEDEEREGSSPYVSAAAKLLGHSKIKQAVDNSKIIQAMRKDGLESIEGTIASAVEPIKKLKGVRSVNDLERITGRQVDIEGALKSKKVDPSTIQPAELDAAVRDALPGLVEQAAAPFVKRLESLKKSLSGMASAYGVSGDPVFQQVMKKFEEGLRELD